MAPRTPSKTSESNQKVKTPLKVNMKQKTPNSGNVLIKRNSFKKSPWSINKVSNRSNDNHEVTPKNGAVVSRKSVTPKNPENSVSGMEKRNLKVTPKNGAVAMRKSVTPKNPVNSVSRMEKRNHKVTPKKGAVVMRESVTLKNPENSVSGMEKRESAAPIKPDSPNSPPGNEEPTKKGKKRHRNSSEAEVSPPRKSRKKSKKRHHKESLEKLKRTVEVSNLPQISLPKMLQELCELMMKSGKIESVSFCDKGENSFVSVVFASLEEARAAVSLNGKSVSGSSIKVSLESKWSDPDVYVFGGPQDLKPGDLEEALSNFGKVIDCKAYNNPETGKPEFHKVSFATDKESFFATYVGIAKFKDSEFYIFSIPIHWNNTVFVSNVRRGTTRQMLREFFSPIVIEGISFKCKGRLVVVTLQDINDLPKALQLNGNELHKSVVKIIQNHACKLFQVKKKKSTPNNKKTNSQDGSVKDTPSSAVDMMEISSEVGEKENSKGKPNIVKMECNDKDEEKADCNGQAVFNSSMKVEVKSENGTDEDSNEDEGDEGADKDNEEEEEDDDE